MNSWKVPDLGKQAPGSRSGGILLQRAESAQSEEYGKTRSTGFSYFFLTYLFYIGLNLVCCQLTTKIGMGLGGVLTVLSRLV